MGTAHNEARPVRSIEPKLEPKPEPESEPESEPEPESDQFSFLCGLTNFVTNSKRVIKINWELTPAEVSVLSSLLTSGVSISQLTLRKELPPDTAVQLGSAIRCAGTIRTMSLGYCYKLDYKPGLELSRALSEAASPALEQLRINNLSTMREWLACDSLDKFTSLHSLTMVGFSGCDCSILLLVSGIGQLRTLESLTISNVYIGDSGAEMLTAALGNHLPLLAKLHISKGLREKAGQPVGSLVALGRLRKLVLDYNNLADKGVSAMVDAILSPGRHNCVLQQLNLRENDIGSAGGIKLAELIAHSPRLRVLDLSRNNMGEASADALFTSIQRRSHSLEELDVSGCYTGPRKTLLVDALRAFTALRVLKLDCSAEGDPDAHALNDALGHALAQFLLLSGGCRLIELHIERSGITETGALELAGVFAKAYTLRSINISRNPLGPRGAVAIVDALATAYTMPMDKINFACCNLGNDVASAAGRLIMRRGCRNALLGLNEMHAAGAKAIMDSAAVSTTCMINLLDLSCNPIGDEGVRYVLDKMMQSRRRLVHRLNIRGIDIGMQAATAIKRAVEEHDMPYWIDVNGQNCDAEVDGILKGVEKWEHDSKPSRNPILQLYG